MCGSVEWWVYREVKAGEPPRDPQLKMHKGAALPARLHPVISAVPSAPWRPGYLNPPGVAVRVQEVSAEMCSARCLVHSKCSGGGGVLGHQEQGGWPLATQREACVLCSLGRMMNPLGHLRGLSSGS